MDNPATYFHWGFVLLSVPNLLTVGLMIVLFLLALIVPMPHGAGGAAPRDDS